MTELLAVCVCFLVARYVDDEVVDCVCVFLVAGYLDDGVVGCLCVSKL